MRKIFLLIFVISICNYWSITINLFPTSAAYHTGTTDGTTFTYNSLIRSESNGGEQGYARFDISSLPADATIISVELNIFVSEDNNAFFKVMSMETDPLTSSAADVYTDITAGVIYSTYSSNFPDPGWYVQNLGNDAALTLQNQLTNDWFAIGLYAYETYGTYYLKWDGWNETNKPFISIEFTSDSYPDPPTNPLPADNAIYQATSGTLTWDMADTDINTYDLWFGTAGNMMEVVSGETAGSTGSYSYTANYDENYEWQVIVHDTDNSFTLDGPVWHFSTLQSSYSPVTAPWTEDFSTWPPDYFYFEGGERNWAQDATSGSAFCNFWIWNGGQAYMHTPLMEIYSMEQLSFKWSHLYSSSYPNDELDVAVSTDGASWSSLWNKTGVEFDSNDGAGSTSPGSFVTETLDLSAFGGETVIIRFLATSGYGPNLYVDDLSLEGFTPIGSGTEADPYQINSLTALQWLSETDSVWNANFIQTADIDAIDTQNWNDGAGFSPIGSNSVNFSGSYDGAGFTISNLFIYRPDSEAQGLFGRTQGVDLNDIHLVNIDITGQAIVGGLVGWGENLNVDSSSVTGSINASSQTVNDNAYTGGLIGRNSSFGAPSTITNCFTNVDIISTDPAACRMGGITGFMLSGWSNQTGYPMLIENCYSMGSITGDQEIGGLVGVLQSHNTNGDSINITNCYSMSQIINGSSNYIGGLIGRKINGNETVTDSFWDTETSGQSTSSGGTGKTTTEMKDYITFYTAGWDFLDETTNGADDLWGMNQLENGGYPFLAWQGYIHNVNLDTPSDVTISISGNEVTLNWPEVAGASSYKIFASDTPDGTFTEITDQGNFGTSRNEINLDRRSRKSLNNTRTLSSEETRSIQNWTITITSAKKFYYVKACN